MIKFVESKINISHPDLPALVLNKGFFYIAFKKIDDITYQTICLRRKMEISQEYRIYSNLSGVLIKNPQIKVEYSRLSEEKNPVYPYLGRDEQNNCTAIWVSENEAIFFEFFGVKVFSFVSYDYSKQEIEEIRSKFKVIEYPELTMYGDVMNF